MTDQLFESSETFEEESVDQGPTEEEIVAKSFDAGVNESLGIKEEEAEQPKPQLIAGMTEDELKAAVSKAAQYDELAERLKRTHDTAFGKIGQLEQVIKSLQAKPQVGKVSKETFKKLAEYFDDENIATALAEDFASVQLDNEPVNLDEINAQFSSHLDELRQDFEAKLLTIQHPDWVDVYKSEEFNSWKGTLKPEAQQTIDTSWDGAVLAQAFTQFKSWKQAKAEAEANKQKRLEQNLEVKGHPGQSNPTFESYFDQGLKKVLGTRG